VRSPPLPWCITRCPAWIRAIVAFASGFRRSPIRSIGSDQPIALAAGFTKGSTMPVHFGQ
jgi:hypothetical protein